MSNRSHDDESPTPLLDEGWWESVLAEEGRLASRPLRHLGPGQARAPRPQEAGPDWAQIQELYRRDQIVRLRVTGCNRGGLLVESNGLRGFVPFSHLVEMAALSDEACRQKALQAYMGRVLELKVIECAPENGRIVFSERAALAGAGKRIELLRSLRVGDRVKGRVTNITDFGVFVDLGGVEGLIHISELSWGRVAHPGQILQLGQSVEVQVLALSSTRGRVALSLKRLLPNPWPALEAELKVGQVLPAVITSVLSYGAFARLEAGVEGLIHASEMPLPPGCAVKEFVHEGQSVQVRVLHVDAAHQRMGLSMKLEA